MYFDDKEVENVRQVYNEEHPHERPIQAGASVKIWDEVKKRLDKEMIMPGDNVKVSVTLINPIAMEDGLKFAIREGGRTVGAGVVSKIIE